MERMAEEGAGPCKREDAKLCLVEASDEIGVARSCRGRW